MESLLASKTPLFHGLNRVAACRREVCPRVAVRTCTPVLGCFELFERSQVRISAKILQREKKLNEKKVVKPQGRREAGEHQLCRPGQPLGLEAHQLDKENPEELDKPHELSEDDEAMIDELLKELEELDKPHELCQDDDAMIDALLHELELEIAFPAREKRIELTAKIEGNELRANPDVSAESISENNGTSSSEATMEAEGRCGSKRSHLTGRFERPNSFIPVEVIQQRPTLCHKRRL